MFAIIRTVFLSQIVRELLGMNKSRNGSNSKRKGPSHAGKDLANKILDSLPQIAGFIAFLYLWVELGSFIAALVVSALFATALTAGWLFYKQKKTGMTPQESLRERNRIRKTKRQWTKALEAAPNIKNPYVPLRQIKGDAKGDLTAIVHAGQNGVTPSSLIKASGDIAPIVGCREVVVTPTGYTGTAKVKFSWSDPLARVVKPSALTNAPKGTAPTAIDDAGNVLGIPIVNSKGETIMTPLFVGGVSGSGKSGFLHSFLAGCLVQEIPVRLHVLDPAGGTELAALGEAYYKAGGKPFPEKKGRGRPKKVTTLAKETDPDPEEEGTTSLVKPSENSYLTVASYSARASDAETMIKNMAEEMTERMMKMAGKTRLHKPTLQEPLNILVIDEFLRLPAELKGADSALAELMSLGRKAGYSVIALSQIGHADAIGRVRELFPRRLCFATSTREQTVAVLGSNDLADQAPAHRISEKTPGVFYGVSETDRHMIKGRTPYYDDRAVYQIAEGHIPYGLENFGTVSTEKPDKEKVPHFVYRLYDRDLRLLYIGFTKDIEERFGWHKRHQPWWSEVSINDTDIRQYANEKIAREMETAGIKKEHPRYNKSQNQNNPFRKVAASAATLGSKDGKSLKDRLFA